MADFVHCHAGTHGTTKAPHDQTFGARLVDFYVRRDSGLLWRSASRCNVHLGGAGAARRGLDEVKRHFRAYQEAAVKAVGAEQV